MGTSHYGRISQVDYDRQGEIGSDTENYVNGTFEGHEKMVIVM